MWTMASARRAVGIVGALPCTRLNATARATAAPLLLVPLANGSTAGVGSRRIVAMPGPILRSLPFTPARWRSDAVAALPLGTASSRSFLSLSRSLSSSAPAPPNSATAADRISIGLKGRRVAALIKESDDLQVAGKPDASVAAAEEARQIAAELVATSDVPRHNELLARAMLNLAERASIAGRSEVALSSTESALALWRNLAELNPGAHESGLASALHCESLIRGLLSHHDAALISIMEAVKIRRKLALNDPTGGFLLVLAISLQRLGHCYGAVGQHDVGAFVMAEAAEVFRDLPDPGESDFDTQLRAGIKNNQNVLHQRLQQLLSALEYDDAQRKLTLFFQRDLMAPNKPFAALAEGHAHSDESSSSQQHRNRQSGVQDHQSGVQDQQSDVHKVTLVSLEHNVRLLRDQGALRNPGRHADALAARLSQLGKHLHAVGRTAEALNAIAEAVQLRRRSLESAEPGDTSAMMRAALAGDLRAMSLYQGDAHQLAATSLMEAVQLLRTLVKDDPVAYGPALADSLSSLSVRETQLGHSKAALAARADAVAVLRELAQRLPDVYRPQLAAALSNLSVAQTYFGSQPQELLDEGLESASEAVRIGRDFANGAGLSVNSAAGSATLSESCVPSASVVPSVAAAATSAPLVGALPGLAKGLEALACCYGKRKEWQKAHQAMQEVISCYRQLATDDPAAYRAQLAASLYAASAYAGELGRKNCEAVAAAAESVAIHRELASSSPNVYLPELATSLERLSRAQGESDDLEPGIRSATEAVKVRKELAQQHMDDPRLALDLAGAVRLLALHGIHPKGTSNGAPSAHSLLLDMAAIYRQLADKDPLLHLPSLARTLAYLSTYEAAGLSANAAATVTADEFNDVLVTPLRLSAEAVQCYRVLAHAMPAIYRDELAASLYVLADDQRTQLQMEAAFVSASEAAQIYRDLYMGKLKQPAAGHDYRGLSELDRHAAALEAAVDAGVLHHRPDVAQHGLAAHSPAPSGDVYEGSALADTLRDLGIDQGRSEHYLSASRTTSEAIRHYRALRQNLDAPGQVIHSLAEALARMWGFCFARGEPEDALKSAEEAAQVYRDLVKGTPSDSVRAALAETLRLCAYSLGVRQQYDKMHAHYAEAVAVMGTVDPSNVAQYADIYITVTQGLASSYKYTRPPSDREEGLKVVIDVIDRLEHASPQVPADQLRQLRADRAELSRLV